MPRIHRDGRPMQIMPIGMIVDATMLFIVWTAHSTAAPGFGLMFEPEYGQAPGRLW